MPIELVLGGARSGKSAFAEQRAQSFDKVIYIATAERHPHDRSFSQRIEQHRQRRPLHWQCIEEPLALTQTLVTHATDGSCLLVDCLTLWLTNHLIAQPDAWHRTQQELLAALPQITGTVLMVSNEVGQGVIPDNALARRFVDYAGRLHQHIAAKAQRVTLVTAGIAQQLKGTSKN